MTTPHETWTGRRRPRSVRHLLIAALLGAALVSATLTAQAAPVVQMAQAATTGLPADVTIEWLRRADAAIARA